MADMKIANFGPFVLGHLEHDLHQKLIICKVV